MIILDDDANYMVILKDKSKGSKGDLRAKFVVAVSCVTSMSSIGVSFGTNAKLSKWWSGIAGGRSFAFGSDQSQGSRRLFQWR